jgi:phage terminase large subunit GpA-like protein
MAGANSGAGLSSRPVRIFLGDEVDRYPPSAGDEGDPVNLGKQRTITYRHRKKNVLVSSPKIKEISRIERAFLAGNQSYYHVPCQRCGGYQRLLWSGIKFDRTDNGDMLDVWYECEHCKEKLREPDKRRMVRFGKWISLFPDRRKHASFHISELYSPWSTWREMVEKFLEAKKSPETLQTFVNLALGETWAARKAYEFSPESLHSRVEKYRKAPSGVLLITGSIDTQDDRLECLIRGWGRDEESWLIARAVVPGSPGRADTWKLVENWFTERFTTEDGRSLPVMSICVDSGGHFTSEVYEFCRRMRRMGKRYIATKGANRWDTPFIPSVLRRKRSMVTMIGVDNGKQIIYDRLQVKEPGPAFMHFNESADLDYFDQLTAERRITKYVKGFPQLVWEKARDRRNEALDLEVLVLAALRLLHVNLNRLSEQIQKSVERDDDEAEPTRQPTVEIVPDDDDIEFAPTRRRKSNFATSWKG